MTPTVVFFGDSITEGAIGASFVELLRQRFGDSARLVNAGINGDTTVNMLRRIGRDVAPHKPAIVVLMAGLNDLATMYDEPVSRRYYRYVKRTPQLPPRQFAASYRALLAALHRDTGARLIIATPTILGERMDGPFVDGVEAYVTIVRAIALQERLSIADCYRAFAESAVADPRHGPPYLLLRALGDGLAVAAGLRTYGQLAERRGYRLFVDGVHLAEAGAQLAADTIEPALRAALASLAPQHMAI